MHDNYRKQTLDALMSAAAQRRGGFAPSAKRGDGSTLCGERVRDTGRGHYSAQEATQILCANTLNKNEAI